MDGVDDLLPTVTSYDYDAPLDKRGRRRRSRMPSASCLRGASWARAAAPVRRTRRKRDALSGGRTRGGDGYRRVGDRP
nr:beta-galactosidase [Leifsonia sp. 21MFCrub1.1]